MLLLLTPSTPVEMGTCLRYVEPWHWLWVWFSLFSDCHMIWQTQILPLCPNGFPQLWDLSSFLALPEPRVRSSSASSPPHFPPLSFALPSYVCLLIILSSCQGLLLVFNQCSVRAEAPVDKLFMHPWREMYSMSTYSYTIFAAPEWTLVTFKTNKHKIKFIFLFTYLWLCNYCT